MIAEREKQNRRLLKWGKQTPLVYCLWPRDVACSVAFAGCKHAEKDYARRWQGFWQWGCNLVSELRTLPVTHETINQQVLSVCVCFNTLRGGGGYSGFVNVWLELGIPTLDWTRHQRESETYCLTRPSQTNTITFTSRVSKLPIDREILDV